MTTADFDANEPLAWLPDEWERFVASKGERPYRALQVFRWIHGRGVADPSQMTDLGRSLRSVIEQAGLSMPATVSHVHHSDDGTKKALLSFAKGGTVETVLIPPLAQDDAERSLDAEDEDEPAQPTGDATGLRPAPKRVTQCISSQVGCAMGCVFCASGVAGLKRNMTAGEIVSQVLIGRRYLESDEALRNVVLMGMGEPLHNYDQVTRALRILLHPLGRGLSRRRITVSTSGLVPAIERLGSEGFVVNLAVSLNASTDEQRDRLMPINKKYPLRALLDALRGFPLEKRQRITIEYVLLKGINDSLEDARRLPELLRGIPCKLNVIPWNPHEHAPYERPEHARVLAFQKECMRLGFAVYIRKTRGVDIDAACGQLAAENDPRAGRQARGRSGMGPRLPVVV